MVNSYRNKNTMNTRPQPTHAKSNATPYLETDVIVTGAGPSGVAAAVAAARAGAQVWLVERHGRLGGAGVTSIVNPLMGSTSEAFEQEVLRRFKQDYGNNWELLDLVYADMLEEAGVHVMLHAWMNGVIMEGRRVQGIEVLTKEGVLTLRARVVVDATADGDVAFAAGAAFEKGRTSDGLLQPMSIMYRIAGVDKTRGLLCDSERQALAVRMDDGRTWHDVVMAGRDSGELPKNVGIIRIYESATLGERTINATQTNHVDGTKAADLTRAEIDGRRQALTVWKFLKKHAPGYETSWISHMPAAVGVRETRRILGLEYLTAADLIAGRKWDTAIVRNASFSIDIHNPDGVGQSHKSGVSQHVQPYDIPYGCLVPRDTDGLLLAGRCISGSHEAHASYRVQRIAMAIGNAAGVAAALACRNNIQPRDVAACKIQAIIHANPEAAAV